MPWRWPQWCLRFHLGGNGWRWMFLLPQGLFECCSSTSSGKPEFLEKEKLVSARPASNLQVSSSGTLDLYFQRWESDRRQRIRAVVSWWPNGGWIWCHWQVCNWRSEVASDISHITIAYIISHVGMAHVAYRIASNYITSHHITSNQIQSHHITSHHITSHHITSHHITPQQISSSSDEQKEEEKATPR